MNLGTVNSQTCHNVVVNGDREVIVTPLTTMDTASTVGSPMRVSSRF